MPEKQSNFYTGDKEVLWRTSNMTIEIIKIVSPYVLFILGIGVSMTGFYMKRLNSRLEDLEDAQKHGITRQEARDMIEDKLRPVEKKLDNIEGKLDRLIEKFL